MKKNNKKSRNSEVEILIAEDSQTQAEQLRYLLEEHGYTVMAAANGKEALALARQHKPTLIISDILMPELDGYGLCRAIKTDEILKDIPVILVTTLTESQDVMLGLECGADNFIRKPYDERYLLSRIEYMLMNLELRKNQRMQAGVEITLGQRKYFITAERQQMLDLLISTYEQAIVLNEELKARENDLAHSNQVLHGLYSIAAGLNHALTEPEVAEAALEHAMALPDVQGGWICMREGESDFRLVATHNLPLALTVPGALDGGCACRKQLLSGKLDSVSNIIECERLAKVKGDTHGLRYHATVPLWLGERTLGLMNLVGPKEGLFDEEELKMLYSVGNQVAMALERARLHEHLEQLVVERTAALQQSESWFRAVFNSQQDAVFVTTPEGRIINANTAVEKIFGYSVAEMRDQPMALLQVNEQHYREVVKHVQQSLTEDSVIHFEHELKRKNGEVFPTEHTFSPMKSETGASEGVVRVIRDITQRKQAEANLKLFRTLLDNSSDAIEVLDPVTLRFFDINETGCRALGYSREELLSMSAFDIDPVFTTDSQKMIEAQLRQSGRAQFETVHRRKDGSTFPVEVSTALIEIDKTYLLSIARDITQRKASEARIARLNRIHSVLSSINSAIVRVHDENELFSEACRIAVELGKFTFAWIGKFDADKQQVTPVAQTGRDDGYLAQINLTVHKNIKGSCALITQALTEVKPVVCNDIASDERMAAWRSEALSRGYRSVTVFPLVVDGQPAGVFVLHASEPGVFDDEEMKLLVEMAGDISFAMDNINKGKKLNYLAYYDVITGLPNRMLFYDRLDQHLHDAQSSEMAAVLAIDLERFRVINETFGRHLGDALLKQMAERLTDTGVGVDHLAHISSDCFAVVLPNVREEADVVHFLENQATAALSKPFQMEGQELRISIKAGIALFPADGKDADTLFRNAEAALVKTKLSGDKYLFYTPEFNARVADRLKLENKLRMALEQEQLVLHYQPKVDLKSNQIVGLEALLRWNDAENGLVPPVKFIPVLEETGMIIEAGAWALAQAMADYRAWQAKGLASPRVAVNVSQVQLQRSDFVNTIERVVSSLGGMTGGLEIEITESLIMQDVEVNIKKLHAIREMGIEVAIDDFGTGYSSLSYIAKLPINSLKIDRAFIINMTSNADDLSIVSAIISLAHSLNLRVIAEGVETNEQAKLLRLLKCDEIQGFLFSPGVPTAQIEEFLRNKKTLA